MNAVDKEYAKKFKFYEKLGRMRLISFILRNFWLQKLKNVINADFRLNLTRLRHKNRKIQIFDIYSFSKPKISQNKA